MRRGELRIDDAVTRYATIVKDGTLGLARLASAIPTEANDDDFSIPFVVTTLTEDRDGDVVVPRGCQLSNYQHNPVCYFGHQQYQNLPFPIAKCKSPDGRITVHIEDDLIRAVMYFDRNDPDAMKIYRKVKDGFLNATSIAFVPIEAMRRDREAEKGLYESRAHTHSSPMAPAGWLFKSYDLTEISVVGVPANAGAIRDWLDTDKELSPRLQKSLVPYAAKALGRSFSGWCPPGTVACPDGTCKAQKSSEPPTGEPDELPTWDVVVDGKTWGTVEADCEENAKDTVKRKIEHVRIKEMDADYGPNWTWCQFKERFKEPRISVKGPYGKQPKTVTKMLDYEPLAEFEYVGAIEQTPPRERWNKSLSSAFDAMPELLMSEPEKVGAATTHRVAAKYLGCQIKDLHQSSQLVPSARMGSFLSGLKRVLAEYRCVEVRNVGDRTEQPPAYETIQLNSKSRDNFLVNGTMFMESVVPRGKMANPRQMVKGIGGIGRVSSGNVEYDQLKNRSRESLVSTLRNQGTITDMDQIVRMSKEQIIQAILQATKSKGSGPHNGYGAGIGDKRFVVRFAPEWGGINVKVITTRADATLNQSVTDRAWAWAKANNFLNGEAFALSGEFLGRTTEGWDDVFLEERNKRAVQRTLELFNKKGVEFANRGVILTGPPGCLHADTPIHDPVDGSTLTVAQRQRMGLPFHVWAMGSNGPVVAQAEAPWKYDPSQMVRLTFQTGRQIIVTLGHRFHAPNHPRSDHQGFVTAQQLVDDLILDARTAAQRTGYAACGSLPGFSASLLRSTAARGLSVPPASAPHSTKTVADSQADCRHASYSCGELPPTGAGIALESPPSPNGARQPRLASSHTDVLDRVCNGNSSPHHLSKTRYAYRSAPRFATVLVSRLHLVSDEPATGQFQPSSLYSQPSNLLGTRPRLPDESQEICVGLAEHAYVGSPSLGGSSVGSILGSHASRTCAQSPLGSYPPGSPRTSRESSAACPSVSPECGSGRTRNYTEMDKVCKAEFIGSFPYYDFHVPGYENYWAYGFFHHNTGKTLSGRIIRNQAKGTFIWVSSRDFHASGSVGGLSGAFDMAKELAPAIVFMEDVDNWLDGRSVDLLKSEMDGIARSKGVLTILTTNFPEQLPEALIDRPGRFHDVLNFDLPTEDARRDMLRKWLPQAPNTSIEQAVEKSAGYSGAHVYELAHFAKTLNEQDDLAPAEAVKEALAKVEQQRELITRLQLAGSNYDPLRNSRRRKGEDTPMRFTKDAPPAVVTKCNGTCGCGGKGTCSCGKKAVQKVDPLLPKRSRGGEVRLPTRDVQPIYNRVLARLSKFEDTASIENMPEWDRWMRDVAIHYVMLRTMPERQAHVQALTSAYSDLIKAVERSSGKHVPTLREEMPWIYEGYGKSARRKESLQDCVSRKVPIFRREHPDWKEDHAVAAAYGYCGEKGIGQVGKVYQMASSLRPGDEVFVGAGSNVTGGGQGWKVVQAVSPQGKNVKITFEDGSSTVWTGDKGVKKKTIKQALAESSGTTGGYTVPVDQDTDDVTVSQGGAICQECGGSGECSGCGGAGEIDGKPCELCGGSGECVGCAGAGMVEKAVQKATKRREVDEAAKKYQQALAQYGENNMVTQRAEIAYRDLKSKWEQENGKKYGTVKSAERNRIKNHMAR